MLVGGIVDIGVRNLVDSEAERIWAINEEGLPGTGKVSQQEIKALLEFSSLSIGAYLEDRLVGFVICLPPNTDYGSLNYAWFNQRYDKFLYVDRIAVSIEFQNQKIGSILYEHVKKQAEEMSNDLIWPQGGSEQGGHIQILHFARHHCTEIQS